MIQVCWQYPVTGGYVIFFFFWNVVRKLFLLLLTARNKVLLDLSKQFGNKVRTTVSTTWSPDTFGFTRVRMVVFTSCWRCEVNMLSKKELEELRPWVSESVTAFLGFSEDTVVNAALDCVAKSLSRQATTGKRILFYLAHTTAASINASPSWGEPEQEAHCAGLCHDTQTMYSSRVCDCCQLTKLHTKNMQWISGT